MAEGLAVLVDVGAWLGAVVEVAVFARVMVGKGVSDGTCVDIGVSEAETDDPPACVGVEVGKTHNGVQIAA